MPAQEALVSSNILTSMNLVAGGFGFALLPAYAEAFSPRNVVSRPVTGEPPTLDLIMAHNLHADDRLASLMTLMDLVRDSVQALA
ncbi:hypothetical protein SDC9_156231 [bioreactor metagenome]|uniref:LysR substrate-binding domain-containing protein n=1 Tax=bioreactor metagenome TaxID=1076179 RepID=A0A645F903_9ZZZZ